MALKLRSVSIDGLRNIEREDIELDPVTVVSGENGTGKSSIVGAISYTLTGRYPGLIGQATADVMQLAATPKGFATTVFAEDAAGKIAVERGVTHDGLFVRVRTGATVITKAQEAAQVITSRFGNVGWLFDSFDPERSLWRKSPEERTKWAFALCAASSGWTRQRLAEELGKASSDWNPALGDDAASCMALNLAKLNDAVKLSQRTGRDAKTTSVTIAAPVLAPSPEELSAAEDARMAAAQALIQARSKVAEAHRTQAGVDKVRRDREQIAIDLKRAETDRARVEQEARAWQAPAQTFAFATEWEELQAKKLDDDMDDELDPAERRRARQRELVERAVAVKKEMAEALAGHVDRRHAWSDCGLVGQWQALTCATSDGHNVVDVAFLCDAIIELLDTFGITDPPEPAWKARYYEVLAAHAAWMEEWRGYMVVVKANEEAWRRQDAECRRCKTQLADLPADQPDVDIAALDATVVAAQAELDRTRKVENELRQQAALAAERAALEVDVTSAKARATQLKELLEKVRGVRERMLADGVQPLRDALRQIDRLAPKNCVWGMQTLANGTTEMGLVRHEVGAPWIPVPLLSTGEKYRATVALLVATMMVRGVPWKALFLDGLEVLTEDGAVSLSHELKSLQMAGILDNVVACAAFSGDTFVLDDEHTVNKIKQVFR